MSQKKNTSAFDRFTNLYSLSKTLRFELKPVGKTFDFLKANQVLMKDEKIEASYQILKPVFDKLHEMFITKSLESIVEKNSKIDFSDYLKIKNEIIILQKNKNNEKDKNKRDEIEKELKKLTNNNGKTKGELEKNEVELRKKFEELFEETGKIFFGNEQKDNGEDGENGGEDENDKKENGFRKLLKATNLLSYIEKNINYLVGDEKERIKVKEALENFKGFATYFSGFELNRNNYYETKEEKATAVASRIISENLPKFCDNVSVFENKKDEYINIFNELKPTGKIDGKAFKDRNGLAKDLFAIETKLFDISHFNYCLSQNKIDEYNEKIGNANFLINLYNQHKSRNIGFSRLRGFKTLYKQIGCGKKPNFIKVLKNNNEVYDILEQAKLAGKKYFGEANNNEGGAVTTLIDFVNYVKKSRENYSEIYLSEAALNTISSKYFGDWWGLADKLGYKKKEKREERNSLPKAERLSELFEVLDKEADLWKESVKDEKIINKDNKLDPSEKAKIIADSRLTNSAKLLELIFSDVLENAKRFNGKATDILKIDINKYQLNESREKIREWLELPININRVLKYFAIREKDLAKLGGELDDKVAEGLKVLLNRDRNDNLPDWFGWFDQIRNYLTKKVGENEKENKLKLNFENSTLAGGWDENKEPERWCVILRDKEDKKYLAILTTKATKFFDKIKNVKLYEGSGYEKMVYKLLPGPNKMLPHVLFKKINKISRVKGECKNSKDIERVYNSGCFKKGDSFNLNDLHLLIDFYKSQLRQYPFGEDKKWQDVFEFRFSDTKYFQSIDQFYNEVEKQGYKIDFVNIDKKKIDEAVVKGEIYLFEIKNKDNNLINGKIKDGSKNLHSIYWDALFAGLENKPKLNGEAEIFYRPAVPEDKMKKAVKKDENGNEIEIKLKNGKIALKNFRFSKEKFIFHCPITLNFCLKDTKINDKLKVELEEAGDGKNILFLGIDRGEKHMAYYSLIDRNKNIIKQGSFNIIKDKNTGKETDYLKLLEEKAGDRDDARKNWTTIGTIKELKDGYISQVVRKIVDIAIYKDVETKELREMPAFIVLEDLNIGFKRGRQKIEKQVYQKLELALAKKLNFLVDKEAEDGEVGSVTKAIQLTPPVNNFGDIKGKQFGNMLYIKADYTSQTDPVTGWRKTIYLKKGSEENIKKQILESFDDIRFDGKDYYFSYTDKNTNKLWALYSSKGGVSLDRYFRELVYENSDKKWTPKKQDLVKMLDELFVGFDKNVSLLKQLKDGENPNKINEKNTAWESLRFAIMLIQQIRNSGLVEEDSDFILSPVRNEKGEHFDSRKEKENLPVNGDANGAFNIARKGIIVSEHIKRGFSKLYISDDEWDAWLAGKDAWEKWIEKNIKDLVKTKNNS